MQFQIQIALRRRITILERLPIFKNEYGSINNTSSPELLSHELYSAKLEETISNEESIVFMHGILGSKKNFRTAAKQIITEKYHFKTSLTLDHRGHGNSTIPPILVGPKKNSVSSCAVDIHNLFSQPQLKLVGNTPMVLCGHSFGGKVALMYLQHCIESGRPLPRHTWILDSIPGIYDKSLDAMQKPDSSVTYVLDSVRRLYSLPGDVFSCKESVVQALLSRGISSAMTQWIATNLVPAEDAGGHDVHNNSKKTKRVRFSFDIDTIVELFDDFCGLDMWDFVHNFASLDSEQPASIHFIRAGRNSLWDPRAVATLQALSTQSLSTSTSSSLSSSSSSQSAVTFPTYTHKNRVLLHHMEHVGHWLHAEDLHGVLSIIASNSSLR